MRKQKAKGLVPLETQRRCLHGCCSASMERPEDGKDGAFQSPRATSWCGRGDHFLACAHGGANRSASSHHGEPGQPTAVTGGRQRERGKRRGGRIHSNFEHRGGQGGQRCRQQALVYQS